MRLRLVTWNVHSCVGTDGRYNPARIAEVLTKLDADVIGLQEVDWRKPNINGRNQFEYLADALGMTPIEGPNLEGHLGRYGNGLLSRLGVEKVERLELAHPGREPRGLIDAHLRAGDHRLRALVTHLGLSRIERRHQLRRIGDYLDLSPTPDSTELALMGDFNEWLPFTCRRRHGMKSRFSHEIAPKTFPSGVPMFRLDRILIGSVGQCALVRVSGLTDGKLASDHLPVCVDLLVGSDS